MAISPGAVKEIADKYQEVMRLAVTDDAFRLRLLANPRAVLAEKGIEPPPGLEVRAVESTDKVVYFAIPPKPPEELSDEQLEQVAGGSTASTAGSIGTASSLSGTILSAGTVGCAGTAG